MKQIFAREDVAIPKNVTKVDITGRTVTVTGPRGVLTKDFSHLKITISKVNKNKAVRVEKWFGSKADLAAVRTIITHIRNMFIGVTKGYLYKMKLVANHFPMTVGQDGGNFEIRNFIGEKRARILPIPEGVTVERSKEGVKEDIIFIGNDINKVSQFCADIHTSTLVKNKDIRKFLDGVYVAERTTVVADE